MFAYIFIFVLKSMRCMWPHQYRWYFWVSAAGAARIDDDGVSGLCEWICVVVRVWSKAKTATAVAAATAVVAVATRAAHASCSCACIFIAA